MGHPLMINRLFGDRLVETFWLALFRPKKERIPPLALQVLVLIQLYLMSWLRP